MKEATKASAGWATSCAAVPSWRRRPSTMHPDPAGQRGGVAEVVGHDAASAAPGRRARPAARRARPRACARRAPTAARRAAGPAGRAPARARRATRWRSPPDSAPGRSSARWRDAQALQQRADVRALAPPKATLPRTVMCGNSAYSWKTRPTERRSGGRSTFAAGVEPRALAERDAPAIGAPQPGDGPQDGRLAGARGADERDGLGADAQAEAELERAKGDGDVELERLHEESIL